MPSKHTINFVANEAVIDHLRGVVALAVIEGVDLSRHGRLSRSGVLRYAVECGAKWASSALRPVAPALSETTGTTDADRLKAARGTMTRAECARAAGLKDESSVRNVESPTRGMKLAGKLLAWVESIEASR